MPLPLEGVRILELTMWGAGPIGVRHLADMGAEVIKIEEFPGGDRIRGIFAATGLQAYLPSPPDGLNYLWEVGNRGKKSVAVDLRKEGGRAVLYRLVKNCDAFISTLRKPALKKYGLDYPTLSQQNPRLVYVHLSSFGSRGPARDLPGQDSSAQARGGMMSQMRKSTGEVPQPLFAVADLTGALQMAYTITLGLLVRERTGIGQELDMSIMGAQITVGELWLQVYLSTGQEPPIVTREGVKNPIRNLYRTRDGKWLCLGNTEGDRYWANFCRAAGREDLVDHPHYRTIRDRAEHAPELVSVIDQIIATRDRAEWLEAFKKYDVISAPVNSYAELATDLQTLANDYVITLQHPSRGPLREVGPTVQLSKTPWKITQAAPELGQHTEEVLTEAAGYTWEELTRLKEQGIIL